MEELIEVQMVKKTLIERYLRNFKKDGPDRRTAPYYETRLLNFKNYWEDFLNRHIEIMTMPGADQAENNYIQQDVFSAVENFYILGYAHIQQHYLKDFPSVSKSESSPKKSGIVSQVHPSEDVVKLPRIQLPKFSGDYKGWPSFHDLFKTLVHENKSLAGVQKLQYLKAHISGEPEHLLRHFHITENNYESAWSALIERYHNKRILVNSQLKALLSQSSIINETSFGIKSLLDTTTECLQALHNLEIDTSNWDPIIVYMIVQKLPSESHQLWEQSLSSKKDLPKWRELKEFLDGRFRTLEAVSNRKQKTHSGKDNLAFHETM